MAATFAARGFPVVGVDIDPEKVRLINEGLPPVDEPLLAETIAEGTTTFARNDRSGRSREDRCLIFHSAIAQPARR